MSRSELLYQNPEVEAAFQAFLGDRIIAGCAPVERRADLSAEVFRRDYRALNRPVILTGITEHWPARRKWCFDYLRTRCGDVTVTPNMYSQEQELAFAEFIDRMRTVPRQGGVPLYLQEWHFLADCPDLGDDFCIPPHFGDDCHKELFNYANCTLWIGPAGATTPLHYDIGHTHVVQTQLVGRKQWFLLSPEAQLRAGADGRPDFEALLADPQCTALHCVTQPGEMIFVPRDWWHRASTLDASISLTLNFVDREHMAAYVNLLLSIPLALALNAESLRARHPNYYKRCMERILSHVKIMGLDRNNVSGL